MARPAHSNIPDTDIEMDDPAKTGTVMTKLRDNALAGRICPFGPKLDEEDSVTRGFGADTYGVHLDTVPLFLVDVADYTGGQRLVRARIQVKTVGGATGSYRLRDNASGNVGTAGTTTSASYVGLVITLDLDSAWKGSQRTIELQYKSSSGSNAAYAKHELGLDWYLEY